MASQATGKTSEINSGTTSVVGGEVVDADDAIARSLELLPPGKVQTEVFAHSVALGVLIDQWYQGRSFDRWRRGDAVWVVGLLGEALTADDVLPPPPFAIFATADAAGYESPAVAGAYFVWHSETGVLLAQGILKEPGGPGAWDTYDRLREISARGFR
jgi:hypothetical protein